MSFLFISFLQFFNIFSWGFQLGLFLLLLGVFRLVFIEWIDCWLLVQEGFMMCLFDIMRVGLIVFGQDN